MKQETKKEIEIISGGIITTAVDLILFAASLGLNLYAASFKGKDPIKILQDSFKLTEKFKQRLLVSSSYYAKNKGLLARQEHSLVLTKKGHDYIKQLLPRYQKNRRWQGRFYLITYDISEEKRYQRDLLRKWLWLQGARLIQESVWISAYDLTQAIYDSKIVRKDSGFVLVSSLEKGMGVGRETIMDLVGRLYEKDLKKVNQRYGEFIKLASRINNFTAEQKFLLKMQYLSILKDDPQLPRSLVLPNWQGDKAYHLYEKL